MHLWYAVPSQGPKCELASVATNLLFLYLHYEHYSEHYKTQNTHHNDAYHEWSEILHA